MKLVFGLVAALACAHFALSQDVVDNGDVIFGPEPDKDAPTTEPTEAPKPTTAEPTEAVKPTEPVIPVSPLSVDSGLPEVENCTGVMCDFEVIRNCPRPVLFVKHCCPMCPDLDLCSGVTCNATEVCSVHSGRAICCQDPSATKMPGGRGRLGHERHRLWKRNKGKNVLDQLRCRFNLTDGCTLRYRTPPITKGVCANASCNSTEVCRVRQTVSFSRLPREFRRSRGHHTRRRYRPIRVQTATCCQRYRPDCPEVEKPTILSQCRIPNQPVPEAKDECNCTIGRFHSTRMLGRRLSGWLHPERLRGLFSLARQRKACRRRGTSLLRFGRLHFAERCACNCVRREAFDMRPPRGRQCRKMPELATVLRRFNRWRSRSSYQCRVAPPPTQ